MGGRRSHRETGSPTWFVRWPLAWERIFTPTIFELTIVYAFLSFWMLAPLAVAITEKRSHPAETSADHTTARFGLRGWFAGALVRA